MTPGTDCDFTLAHAGVEGGAAVWFFLQREKAGAANSGAVAAAYGRRYEEWVRARRRPLRRVGAL